MNRPSKFMAFARRRLAQGRCVSCGQPKEADRSKQYRCLACVAKYRRKPAAIAPEPPPVIHLTTTICLGCGRPLQTPDRCRIRFHDRCRLIATYNADRIADEWSIFA